MQLYAVDVEDKKSKKVSAIYVFDNHEAALKCRRDLGLKSDHLRGVVIFNDWRDGQPYRSSTPSACPEATSGEGGTSAPDGSARRNPVA